MKELALLDVYPTRGRRGPEATVKPALEKTMLAYIRQKGAEEFLRMKKEELAAHFKASLTTAWEVRKAIASQLTNSDKTPKTPTSSDRQ